MDRVSLSAETVRLPDMRGSGAVRDLREAAQGSSGLAAALQAADLMDREVMRVEAANDGKFVGSRPMKRRVA